MVVLALCIQCIQLVLVLLAGTCMHTAHATITIAGTGVRFPSHPGRLAGSRWMEGYEYMARLQLLEEQANMDLCYSSDSDSTADHKKNFTVTKPSDGLPVVLLVSGDHCSDAVKVEVAMSKIRPKSTVSYLIIYDTDPSTKTVNTAAPNNWHWHYWHGDNSQNEYENHIKVLHVTWKTGNDLFKLIVSQDPKTTSDGGLRVLMDGTSSTEHNFLRALLFWVGLSLMMSGCVCSFCLSVWLQENPPPEVPSRRPERRRLTREQVQLWLPPFLYQKEEEESSPDTTAYSCECSICLDDYKEGDYIRKLPCNHEFHSDCIAKWLVERHSTCPLCKLDLLPEEEEEEEEEEASVIDNADADEHNSVQDSNNRSSVLQFLIGNLPLWSQRLARPAEESAIEAVDQTPLLEEHQEHNVDV